MIEQYITLEGLHSFCVAYTILTMWFFTFWLVYKLGYKHASSKKIKKLDVAPMIYKGSKKEAQK